MGHNLTLLCALALAEAVVAYGGNIPKDYNDRMEACVDVAQAAVEWDLEPAMMVAMAYEETSLTPGLESSRGALGIIQIMPHHHCPGGELADCDLTEAAMHAVKKKAHLWACGEDYRSRADAARNESRDEFDRYTRDVPICPDPDWAEALCHYNAGNQCFNKSRVYARNILRRQRRLNYQVAAALGRP